MADPQSTVSVDVLVAVIAVVQLAVQGLVQVVMGVLARGKASEADERLLKIADALEKTNETREAEGHMIRDLYDMHRVTDKDGRPIWYFPGSVGEVLKDISKSQADLARILEGVVKQLERTDRRTRQ